MTSLHFFQPIEFHRSDHNLRRIVVRFDLLLEQKSHCTSLSQESNTLLYLVQSHENNQDQEYL